MRILFISRWYPYPPDNGARIRIFNLIKHLSERNEITLVSFAEGEVDGVRREVMERYCRAVHAVSYRPFCPTRIKALLGLLSPRPRSLVDTYSSEVAALISRLAASHTFDVVLASQRDMALYPFLLPHTPRVLEELELAVLYEQFARQRRLPSRMRYWLTWVKMSRFVARLLRSYQGVTVVSEPERALVCRIAPGVAPMVVVPNGVDLETHTGVFGSPEPDSLIYSGALTYDANFDAMDYFLRDIWPLIRAAHPAVKLTITGRTDGVPLERLQLTDGVILTGYLDDIRPAVASSRVCVVPLRTGGGTRLKILEAMALGTPVVATSKGAEGLDAANGKHLLIADTPGDFAQAVSRLFSDDGLHARLAANGRQLVESRYSWKTCALQLEHLLNQAAGKRQVADA